MLEVLDVRQRARLDQIQLQVEGPVAFCRAEVRERLQLDPERGRTIHAMVARAIEQTARAVEAVAANFPQPSGPWTPERSRAFCESQVYQDAIDEERKITRKARNETLQAVMKMINRDQQAAYRAMLGKPFDLTKLRGESPPR